MPSLEVAYECHLCRGTEQSTLFETHDRFGLSSATYEVRRCSDCGLMFTWPSAKEDDLSAFYPNDYWGEGSEPKPSWIQRSQREKTDIVEHHALGGRRILDVGCGAGFFLRALDAERWVRFGVEIDPGPAAVAERHIGSGRVFAGRLADVPYNKASFDIVTFWASLEHLVAPRVDLLIAHDLLADAGTLVVQVPNADSAQARRFGPDWFALDVPRHRFHFSRSTLSRLLDETGFNMVETLLTSETHDVHALKQSIKSRLVGRGARFGRLRFFALNPFFRIANRMFGGATLTVVARRR